MQRGDNTVPLAGDDHELQAQCGEVYEGPAEHARRLDILAVCLERHEDNSSVGVQKDDDGSYDMAF